MKSDTRIIKNVLEIGSKIVIMCFVRRFYIQAVNAGVQYFGQIMHFLQCFNIVKMVFCCKTLCKNSIWTSKGQSGIFLSNLMQILVLVSKGQSGIFLSNLMHILMLDISGLKWYFLYNLIHKLILDL